MSKEQREKISIIEGPPPIFEEINDGWALGLPDLTQGPDEINVRLVRLRSFNAPALRERCYQAWHDKNTIDLHYKDMGGLEKKVPIVAARAIETKEGHVLLLWVNLPIDQEESPPPEFMTDDNI